MSFGSPLYDARMTVRGWWRHATRSRRAPDSSRDVIDDYKRRCVRNVLIDAQGHVPYYRDLFARIGFDPRTDFRTLDDLQRLPVLTKSVARANAKALLRCPLPRGSIRVATSGSTGEPFQVWITPRQIAVEKATVWRHWSWLGYRFRDRMAIVRTYVPSQGGSLWRRERPRNFLYLSAYHLDDGNTAEFLRMLRDFRPRYLRGYPTSLATLARRSLRDGIGLPSPPRAILTASETLRPDQREVIERAFGAPVRDWYGLAEQVVTANQCDCGDGYVINDDYGHAELIPRSDTTDTGLFRLVGTNLHNTAMPLIRYDTGDLVESAPTAPCRCGIRFSRIAAVSGRCDDELIAPGGRRLPAVNFYSVFRDHQWIDRFQIVQTASDAVDVRLATSSSDTAGEEQLVRALTQRLGEGTTVTIRRNAEFERSRDGKHRAIISRLGQVGRPDATTNIVQQQVMNQ